MEELWSKAQTRHSIIERSGTKFNSAVNMDLAMRDAETRLQTGGGLLGKGGISMSGILGGNNQANSQSTGVIAMSVNPFLWRAALETIDLLTPKSYLKSKNMYDYNFTLNENHSNLQEGDVLRKETGLIAQDLLKVPGGNDYVYQNQDDSTVPMKVDYNSIFNLNINN